MKVGEFIAGQKKVLQIEKATQVHQLSAIVKTSSISDFFKKSIIRVWNNYGQIIPPMSLADLSVLNGDEYPLQVGFDFVTSSERVVVTYEICDEGSINRPVYVELDLTLSGVSTNIELDSIDVTGTTAVKMRGYNFMNVVSPAVLPKNSVCIFDLNDVLTIQKNKDLMGNAEIWTHSNCILREGTLEELHPIVYDTVNNSPIPCVTYTEIALDFFMGYGGSKVIIQTGDDEFLLSPDVNGCAVTYCQKSLTKIAQQVRAALISQGQANNVDKQEFASAVAAVGNVASKQGLTTDNTQSVANKVVGILPSSKLSMALGIKNFNLASESVKKSGITKTL